jgi:Protein of unknown function (DUF4239)
VIYAVLLALVVITVWEEYQSASETVEQEANSVAEIFLLGYELPEPEGTHLQQLARSYAEEVVHKEWPLMAQGKQTPLEHSANRVSQKFALIEYSEIRVRKESYFWLYKP